jgi:uncharacterized LabA/DUF88 family protein
MVSADSTLGERAMMKPSPFVDFPSLPVEPPRFAVYIDGYNLYYAINHPRPEDLLRLGWCNYQRLGELLVEKSFACPVENPLVTVKYFTAEVNQETQHKGEAKRQKIWLDALSRDAPKLDIKRGMWSKKAREEKMTDVKIALEIAKDIIDRRPAGIVLVSGDLDFQPLVQHVADARIPIAVFTPDDHPLYELEPGKDASLAQFAHLTQDLMLECHLKSDFLPYLRLKVEAKPEFRECLLYEERRQKPPRP